MESLESYDFRAVWLLVLLPSNAGWQIGRPFVCSARRQLPKRNWDASRERERATKKKIGKNKSFTRPRPIPGKHWEIERKRALETTAKRERKKPVVTVGRHFGKGGGRGKVSFAVAQHSHRRQ